MCNLDPGHVSACLLTSPLDKGILFGENTRVTLDSIQNEAGNHILVDFGIPWMDTSAKVHFAAHREIPYRRINSTQPASGFFSFINILMVDTPSSSDPRWGDLSAAKHKAGKTNTTKPANDTTISFSAWLQVARCPKNTRSLAGIK